MEERRIFDEDGYDQNGYDKYGYNRNFEIDESSPISIISKHTLKILGYENNGLNPRGFRFDEIHHITRTKYDEQGYDINGWNQEGIHIETQSEYNPKGFNIKGIHENGTPYDDNGYDIDGFNSKGINRRHFRRDGINTYTNKKYDYKGYDIDGFNEKGYDINGFDKLGYDENGFNKEGYDFFGNKEIKLHPNSIITQQYNSQKSKRESYLRNHAMGKWIRVDSAMLNFNTKTLWGEDGYTSLGVDREGYDRDGYNEKGYNREGYDREGFNDKGINKNGLTKEQQEEYDLKEQENKVKQRRSNYLGLIDKAKKLGKGELSLEDYVKTSKTSIDDLIDFAKKEKMSADVIRGLYKYKKPYALYKKPFSKKQYLESTTLLIDGQKVKPTEEDVDKCIAHLKANDALICDKTVRDTVRKFLKGEIDITIKSENEEEIKDTLVEDVLAQQKKIKSQESKIADLKSQVKGEV